MTNPMKLNLNLASNPIRNRRFYIFLFTLLAISICIVGALSGSIYFKYRNKANGARAAVRRVELKISETQRKANRFNLQIDKVREARSKEIDMINGIIYMKSFSWMEFFSALEDALPGSSYISSLSPSPEEGMAIEVRFKVASPTLNELLKFISNLRSKGFDQIKVISEFKNEVGYLLSEISLRYERNI